MHRSLIIDPVAAGRELVARVLSDAGFSVAHLAPAPGDAGAPFLFDPGVFARVDLVVVSHRAMPIDEGAPLEGWEAFERVRGVRRVSGVSIIVVSSVASVADCERAMRAGADRFLLLRDDMSRLAGIALELLREKRPDAELSGPCTLEQARKIAERELRERLQGLIIECRGNVAEVARRMNRDRSTVRYHLRRLHLLE